jgi:hypothetical protein
MVVRLAVRRRPVPALLVAQVRVALVLLARPAVALVVL